ncbi:MAG TPA: branched-chain-amino-acid transaminase [Jatrophihabitans sp.]|uniref:branched-chain-amino-acid transaminase n=1 Tax=Jatrophihabitans sp. TaxID=1932789 RepID=UPI002F1B89C2
MSALADQTPPPRWIWRDGAIRPWAQATVHVNAVGHASVAAVFEGIKAYRAADSERLLVFRLDEHLDRLLDSARLCRLHLPHTRDELRQACLDLLAANDYRADTYLRPWVFARGLIREQMVPAGAECETVIDSWPFTSQLRTGAGCRAAVSSWIRVPAAAMPPRAKAFANYHNGRLALIEARENGHDWPVMLNDRHQVAEGAAACVALVIDGVLVTPSLASGALAGITRDSLLALAREQGVPVQEREVDRSELYLAEEIFFMGTAWEILPVVAIDGLRVGDGTQGPVAALLEREYSAIVRGQSDRRPQWLTPVEIGGPTAVLNSTVHKVSAVEPPILARLGDSEAPDQPVKGAL